jgi:hypothetical protein
MKKSLLILFFIFLSLITTGCVKMHNTLVINKDGSSDLTVVYGVDHQLYAMGPEVTKGIDEMRNDAEKNGFKVVNYKDSKVTGIKITKHFEDYKDITVPQSANADNAPDINVKETKGFFKTKYKVESVFDLSGMTESMGSDEDEEFDQQMASSVISQMDLNFTLKLPVEAGENNATDVSNGGKTLKWEIIPDQENALKVEFEKVNILNIVLISVGFIIFLLVALFIILKRRKQRQAVEL